jgi:hypothetical protein
MRELYFTHCCAKKDEALIGKGRGSPYRLYIASPTQRFMRQCNRMCVEWAIFSDKYGFVFSHDLIEWYEKHPSTVTETEKLVLFTQAFRVLSAFDRVSFYYNPGRLHPLYRQLISEMRKRGKEIREITHLKEVCNRRLK